MDYITLAVPFFLLALLVELVYGIAIKKNTYRLNDAISNLFMGTLRTANKLIIIGAAGYVFYMAETHFALWRLDPTSAFTWIFAFIIYDFFYYWFHRISHERQIFWASHAAHHQSEDYNLSTALRQTGTGALVSWVFYIPMFLIGVPSYVFVSVASLNLIYQFWVHSEHIPKLGWYENYFVTASNHRVHHAQNEQYIDKNYGGVFIIWDRMFGTYTARLPDVVPVYGTATALKSWNPIWANLQVYSIMISDSIKTKKWSDKVKVWYSKTYWRPEDCIEDKDPKEFYVKYNPEVSSDIKVFGFFQMLFTIAVSGSVLFFLPQHTYNEIIVFAITITSLSSLTAFLLQGTKYAYASIFNFSVLGVLAIYYLGALNIEILSTQLLMGQLLINILIVSLISIYQRLNLMQGASS